jgi:alpha-beta hydrolase superfamily lysophospholipase
MSRETMKGDGPMREFSLGSSGGGFLRCGVWAPKGEPVAVVQLIHGIAEHIDRYAEFGDFLAEHGFLMVADDHMGHGKSAAVPQALGYFPSGWLGAVSDEHRLMEETREQNPGKPYFLLGHSMGSFLARTFLYRYPDAGLSGVILSGTAWQPKAALQLGTRLCAREEKRLGATGRSELLQNLVFGSYNRKFRHPRTDCDWICTDPAVVDAYVEDPLCGFMPTVGLCKEMMKGIGMNQWPGNLQSMPKKVPVLFFSGSRDPVGSMGRGVVRSAKEFRRAGMQDVACRLYPGGRHEMLNEPNRQEVYDDILRWLQEKLAVAKV